MRNLEAPFYLLPRRWNLYRIVFSWNETTLGGGSENHQKKKNSLRHVNNRTTLTRLYLDLRNRKIIMRRNLRKYSLKLKTIFFIWAKNWLKVCCFRKRGGASKMNCMEYPVDQFIIFKFHRNVLVNIKKILCWKYKPESCCSFIFIVIFHLHHLISCFLYNFHFTTSLYCFCIFLSVNKS